VAEVYFSDTKDKQVVSVLELNSGGPDAEDFGVRYGQHVLLCDDNDSPFPIVPALGDLASGMEIMLAREQMMPTLPVQAFGTPFHPSYEGKDIDWFGEVYRLYPDGTVGVLLVNGQKVRVQLKQLMTLNEPAMDAMMEEELNGMGMDMEMDESESLDMDDLMQPHGYAHSQASWETLSGDEDKVVGDVAWEDGEGDEDETMSDGEHASKDVGADMQSEDGDSKEEAAVEDAVGSNVPPPSIAGTPDLVSLPELIAVDFPTADAGPSRLPASEPKAGPAMADDESWRSFDILEEAPADHHFIKQARLEASSKTYRSRLSKEHKALYGSLPGELCPLNLAGMG
jgi:ubiquitin-conjugating enzyme E2 O